MRSCVYDCSDSLCRIQSLNCEKAKHPGRFIKSFLKSWAFQKGRVGSKETQRTWDYIVFSLSWEVNWAAEKHEVTESPHREREGERERLLADIQHHPAGTATWSYSQIIFSFVRETDDGAKWFLWITKNCLWITLVPAEEGEELCST